MSKQKEVLAVRSSVAGALQNVALYDTLTDLLPGKPYFEVKHDNRLLYAQLNEVNSGNNTNGRLYRKSDNKTYQFASAAVLPIKFKWTGEFRSSDGGSFPGTTQQIGSIESTTQQTVKIWLRYQCSLNEPRSGSTGIRVVIGSSVGPGQIKTPTASTMVFDLYANTPVIISIPKGTLKVSLQGFKPKWAGFTWTNTYVKITNDTVDAAGWPS